MMWERLETLSMLEIVYTETPTLCSMYVRLARRAGQQHPWYRYTKLTTGHSEWSGRETSVPFSLINRKLDHNLSFLLLTFHHVY